MKGYTRELNLTSNQHVMRCLLLKFAGNKVRKYLHLTVGVGSETLCGLNAILINDPKTTKSLKFGISISSKHLLRQLCFGNKQIKSR